MRRLGNWEMKIGGVYILSRRSIARMIATITAALMTFYAATTAQAQATVHRIHDATVALVSLDRQMVGRLTRTVVPDFMYLEYKALYLMLKPSVALPRRAIAPPPVRHGTAAVAACGFSSRDRKLLNEIHRAAVFGETPVDARVSGDIRRSQVLYGASLYRPSSRHVKGVSSTQAARSAIKQFRGRPGAYSLEETASLAKAILREYQSLKT